MFSPTRGPERLVRLAQWAIALLFAFFLIRVGGSILADLPALTQPPQRDAFLKAPAITALEARLQPLEQEQQALEERRAGLRQRQEVARQTYGSTRASFETWRAARSATELGNQNPEVIARARLIDEQLQLQMRLGAEQQALERQGRGLQARIEKALHSLGRSQCPSCERNLPVKEGTLPDFCMHCGLALQLDCPRCQHHHISFFPYCPSCGLQGATAPPESVSA